MTTTKNNKPEKTSKNKDINNTKIKNSSVSTLHGIPLLNLQGNVFGSGLGAGQQYAVGQQSRGSTPEDDFISQQVIQTDRILSSNKFSLSGEEPQILQARPQPEPHRPKANFSTKQVLKVQKQQSIGAVSDASSVYLPKNHQIGVNDNQNGAKYLGKTQQNDIIERDLVSFKETLKSERQMKMHKLREKYGDHQTTIINSSSQNMENSLIQIGGQQLLSAAQQSNDNMTSDKQSTLNKQYQHLISQALENLDIKIEEQNNQQNNEYRNFDNSQILDHGSFDLNVINKEIDVLKEQQIGAFGSSRKRRQTGFM